HAFDIGPVHEQLEGEAEDLKADEGPERQPSHEQRPQRRAGDGNADDDDREGQELEGRWRRLEPAEHTAGGDECYDQQPREHPRADAHRATSPYRGSVPETPAGPLAREYESGGDEQR